MHENADTNTKNLKSHIRDVPDFPRPGVCFRDITPLLYNPEAFRLAVEALAEKVRGLEFDVIAGAEARGFLFAAPLALTLAKPLAPIRKKGKLPRETVSAAYALEYGTATLELHRDAIKPGQRVLIVDDLIATGGTTAAMIELVESLGGKVAALLALMELAGLQGRERLKGHRVESVLLYD